MKLLLRLLLLLTVPCALAAGSARTILLPGAHWTQVNGHKLYYQTRGAGRPLLLLHGGGNNVADAWGEQLEAFSSGHQIIAPEQVGQGHTPDIPGPLDYAAMAEDTVALLRQLHLKNVDVIGHSDGAILALIIAVRHPELVRRMVISGANLEPSGLTAESLAETRATPATAMMSPEDQAEYDAMSPDGHDHAVVINEKLRQLWLTQPTHEQLSPDLLRHIDKPVLVMSGDHDEIRLDHTLLIFRSLPQAHLWILPDTGHMTFNTRARWVNPVVLSFLDGQLEEN